MRHLLFKGLMMTKITLVVEEEEEKEEQEEEEEEEQEKNNCSLEQNWIYVPFKNVCKYIKCMLRLLYLCLHLYIIERYTSMNEPVWYSLTDLAALTIPSKAPFFTCFTHPKPRLVK